MTGDVFYYRIKNFVFLAPQDENGDGNGVNNYVADSIGTYAVDSKPSPFRNLKVYSNGTEWTLMDFETNARYFGSGL